MCGITGFIDFNKSSSVRDLQKMTDIMHHRGPDGSGYELINQDEYILGLGHRRLSIIDLSNSGTQPMSFQKYWICFNGEVYNYAEIKKELEGLGHVFISSSDTEVVLQAYVKWGSACVDRFIGMFAFVIYNSDNGEVFCCRDRAGVKPFYYYIADGLFLFSSELKSFHQHKRFEKKLNLASVSAFMQYGNVPTPHCIFQNTYKLKPGHFLSFNTSQELNEDLVNPMRQKCYWNVYDSYNKPKLGISFDAAKQETEKILKSACDYRMVADVPVGVFLSGGYDSASVTALLQKDRTEKLKTFTISVPDIGLDEAPFAKEIAGYLGTDHTEIKCSHKEAIELIEELPFYYDEPFADSSAIPTTLVSLAARKHVTVALSADAGDEVFAGYNRYDYIQRYGERLNKIPSFLRNTILKGMERLPSNAVPYFRNTYNFHNRYEKIKGVLRNPTEEQIMMSLSEQFTDAQMQKIATFNYDKLSTAYASKELKADFFSPLSFMMAVDYQTYLVDDILQKVDRASMSVSLEGREPYLDHRLIEWAAQLPNEFKYNKGEKKFILKEILHDYIPKEMMDRPKMGFAIPIASWLQNDLRHLVDQYINEDLIRSQHLFDWSVVGDIKRKFLSGKKEYDVKLWYFLTFQMWYEKWMS
jgi:asparagine synthase (glutamine-hydrolysing)